MLQSGCLRSGGSNNCIEGNHGSTYRRSRSEISVYLSRSKKWTLEGAFVYLSLWCADSVIWRQNVWRFGGRRLDDDGTTYDFARSFIPSYTPRLIPTAKQNP